MGVLDGKIAIVTGSGHGIGRAEALELAAQGAAVLVNDLGGPVNGEAGADRRVADAVAAEIRARGGRASANHDDVGSWEGARRLIGQAVDEFGALDSLVNNAGVMRPGEFVDISEDDWETLMHTHLKGTFNTMHHAAAYWKAEAEAGRRRAAAIVNTTSAAGLPGGSSVPGMVCYGVMKAGIASLTVGTAPELAAFGVRVNAIAPSGYTRMIAFSMGHQLHFDDPPPIAGVAQRDPAVNGPLVAWLASDLAKHVTGQVFSVSAGAIVRYEPWRPGPEVKADGRWIATDIGRVMEKLGLRL